jgi:hypothetical protein
MANAMTTRTTARLKANPTLSVHRGPFTYTIETKGEKSNYSVSDGTRMITLPVKWTFGVDVQAWMMEKDGHLYESLVSYYPESGKLDLTVGDERLKPQTLEQAVGREISAADLKQCLGCHATNTVVNNKVNLDSFQTGVRCEHCHRGSDAHALDALNGVFDSAPPSLKNMSAEETSGFCGQCHRTWETVVRNHWRGEANVRFAPYRLANSRCFDGADPRISCLACHDPHQNVVRQAAWYDSKCTACHSAAAATPSTREQAKPCPVAKTECITCHMPKVKLPDESVTFTDHQIRIVKAGDPYPN